MRGRLRRRAGHADRDSFIGLHHSQRLFAAYAGDKNLVTFGGDHNSHRAPFFYSSAVIFLHAALQCRTPLPRGEPLVDPAAHLRTCAVSRAWSCQRIVMRVEPAPSCARVRVNSPPHGGCPACGAAPPGHALPRQRRRPPSRAPARARCLFRLAGDVSCPGRGQQPPDQLCAACAPCRRNVVGAADELAAGAGLQRELSAPWVRGGKWTGSPEDFEEAWLAEVARR